MSDLSCGLSPDSNISKLTVGDIFKYRCQGDWPAAESWELRVSDEDAFKLKLLDIQKVADGVMEMHLVSYRLGQHDLKAVQLVSAEHSVLLGDIKFEVASVQNPESPVQEPFGPWPGVNMAFPWAFGGLTAALLLAVIFSIAWPVWVRRRRRRWMTEIPASRFSTPEQDLYRVVRIGKTLPELDQGFRFYLGRKFSIPAHHLSARAILKELKKAFPEVHERFGRLMSETLIELQRAAKETNIEERDLEGIRDRIRQLLDRFDRELPRQRGST